MLEDSSGSPTHKATPGASSDLKNWVLLKLTGNSVLEFHTIDEAFNFRPTVRHPVYTLEEAEMLMSAKRRPKITPTLKAQMDAIEKSAAQTDGDKQESGGGSLTQDTSRTDDSDQETTVKRQKKKSKTTTAEWVDRAPREVHDVMATDDLIETIRPADVTRMPQSVYHRIFKVEDWEFSEAEDDDDLSMGADFEEEEKDEMEAEYKQHLGSDASDNEETKLDDKGKELQQLIDKGATEYVPSPSSPGSKKQKISAEQTIKEEKPKTGHVTEQLQTKIKLIMPQELRDEAPANTPKGISEEEICRFLKSKGSIDLKQLIDTFKRFFASAGGKRRFIDILKKLVQTEERNGTKFVSLKHQYL